MKTSTSFALKKDQFSLKILSTDLHILEHRWKENLKGFFKGAVY